MRGLNTKLQTMMAACTNVTYHEAVNIAIASEEKYQLHTEIKKKKSVPWIFWWKSKEAKDNLSSSQPLSSSLSSAAVPSRATIKSLSCYNLPEFTTDKCSWCQCSNVLGSQLSMLQLWKVWSFLQAMSVSQTV